MSTYDMVAARRAAAALQEHIAQRHNGKRVPDLSGPVLREAVVELMVDLKHLLVRDDWTAMLTELAGEAVDRWAEEEED